MYYDDNFVLSLPDEDYEKILLVLDKYYENKNQFLLEEYDETVDLIKIIVENSTEFGEFLIFNNIKCLENRADQNSIHAFFRELYKFCEAERRNIIAEKNTQRFSSLLKKSFHYEFSDADIGRIQQLINNLRELINVSDDLAEDHKARLFARLESLQRELHRRVSRLDQFYAMAGEAGVLLGKLGTDAKPLVDRIREILEIVWRADANANALPASARPALLSPDSPALPPTPDEG